jgi:chromosome partitioning protein
MRTNTTLVINSKGGSGKTTVATNLASYFAANGMATTVMDYDPQGSSMNWVRLRPAHLRKIHGANAAPQKTGLRTIGMHVPAGTQQLIIDAPAGVCGLMLQELLARAHCILIPVAPSAIDIHATANFIRDLLLTGKIRANNIRLGVVANRVRKSNPVYQPLERFLNSLQLPLLARLSDTEVFLTAAETGVGIFEMEFADSAAERGQFLPIAEWVDRVSVPAAARSVPFVASATRPGLRVVGSITSSQPGFR